MKKIFLTILAICGSMAMAMADEPAPNYLLQTGKEGDPTWSETTKAAFPSAVVVDLSQEGKSFSAWLVSSNVYQTHDKCIWFAGGTYDVTESVASVSYWRVQWRGGFVGTETSLDDRALLLGGHNWDFANQTILDGGGKARLMNSGLYTYNSRWNGITFQNMNGNLYARSWWGGSTTFQNCQFKNMSDKRGGAVETYRADIIFIDCYFENNKATDNQGGAFFGNQEVNGSNTNGTTTFTGCMFVGNQSPKAGGAIYRQGVPAVTITDCIFKDNVGSSKGAVVWGATEMTNCFVDGNAITGSANILLVPEANSKYYYNTVIGESVMAIDNDADIEGNILLGAVSVSATGATLAYNAAPTALTGTGNIVVADVAAAKFADAANNNYQLTAESPMVDAGGDAGEVNVFTDILGVERPQGEAADMGCYELVGGQTTAIEKVEKPAFNVNAPMYNVMGQKVNASYKGIVLQEGHTFILH